MILVNKEDLQATLNVLGLSCSKSPTLAILRNVKVSASKNKTVLSTTNLINATEIILPTIEVEEDFETTVPLDLFMSLISSRPDGQIKIRYEEKGEQVQISQGRWRSTLKGIPAMEFPILKATDTVARWCQSASSLLKTLNLVAFNAAKDDSRPTLTGINIKGIKDSHAVFAATDGYRLGKYTTMETVPNEDIDVILPESVTKLLQRAIALDEDDSDIEVGITESQAIFQGDGWTIYTQLISGNYPDYSPIAVVPSCDPLKIDSEELALSTKSAMVLAKESTSTIVLAPENGSLTITGESTEYGTSEEVVTANVNGQCSMFAINGRYLLDVLANAKNGSLTVKVESQMTPIFISPEGQPDLLWIIMPMHFGR